MKIGIVGDLHIAPVPEKRIDDYFQTGLNKIEQIAQYCDKVIFTGDIFSVPKIDEKYVNPLIRHLDWCKTNYNCEFITAIGNHDVANELEEHLEQSSLGTLEAAKIMTVIKPGINNSFILKDKNLFYRFQTIPVKFKDAKEYLKEFSFDVNPNFINILIVHHLYETGMECFNYEDFQNKNINMIFFGHDHKPMDGGRKIYTDFTVYRSGSLMRNIANDYNLERSVYYYVLEDGKISCKAINIQDAKSVFNTDAYNRTNYNEKKYIEVTNEQIDNLIEHYKNNISIKNKFSIKDVLKEVGTPDNNIDYIGKQYQKIGEIF